MPQFFADFRQSGRCWIRHNTRIYLSEFTRSQPAGQCIGAIVAKNPGSANSDCGGWRPLNLDGDKMLPNVRNILLKAYAQAGKSPPRNAYLQVLNLFYICGKDLKQSITLWKRESNEYRDPAEDLAFPIIWFAWGPSSALNPLKGRFSNMKFDHSFYYSPANESVVTEIPQTSVLAKHPQGMPHDPVVKYLASLL